MDNRSMMMDQSGLERCRLCFLNRFQLLPMFPANEPVNDELLRKIRECAAVAITYEEDQDSVICIKCIVDVEQFHGFKERCKVNDRLLRDIRRGQGRPVRRTASETETDHVKDEEECMDEYEHEMEVDQCDETPLIGPGELLHVGYNYQHIRAQNGDDLLIYRRHRFCRTADCSDSYRWNCVLKERLGCPAKVALVMTDNYPLVLYSAVKVRHNHDARVVEAIGGLAEGTEQPEMVLKTMTSHALVLQRDRTMAVLHDGYRFRLRKSLDTDGTTFWECTSRAGSGCPAAIWLSYEDEKCVRSNQKSHNHEPLEPKPNMKNTNGSLLGTMKMTPTVGNFGYNYKLIEDNLLFQRNYYRCVKAGKNAWMCLRMRCPAKVKLLKHRKSVEVVVGRHTHASESIQEPNGVNRTEEIKRGVNYRLWCQPSGIIWLVHRREHFRFAALLKNGTSEWICAWHTVGCTARVRMVPDEQFVYSQDTEAVHLHRVGNALEAYFPDPGSQRPVSDPSQATVVLWCGTDYRLLRNHRGRTILERNGFRYSAKTARPSGKIAWRCTSLASRCKAMITIDKEGRVEAESGQHHHKQQTRRLRVTPDLTVVKQEPAWSDDIFNNHGPVELLAGGFNFRRMINLPLKLEIIVYCSHKYLRTGEHSSHFHCILRDQEESCPGRVILTNNDLCAELAEAHNHSSRVVRKITLPQKNAQITVEGPNYELIYSMSGRNCVLIHEGHVFRLYKMLEPIRSSRWRCLRGEAGCKTYLNVPLSLTKPAVSNGWNHCHDNSSIIEDITAGAELCSIVLKEEPSLLGALVKMEPPDPNEDGLSQPLCFINGQLYVRQSDDSNDTDAWCCAFWFTLGCPAGMSAVSAHNHERFVSVKTTDRFAMLKVLISRGIVRQRGNLLRMPDGIITSDYELLPSNGNLSLNVDGHRYYFYKAKNNGEWLWRCVRHRWQGCKIGVAVSHCFRKYYFQPNGTLQHEHS